MGPAAPLLVIAAAAMGGFGMVRRLLGHPDWSTREAVARSWQDSFPGDRVEDSVVSRDGRAALVATGWGTGVISRGGIARRLDRATTVSDGDGLVIHFDDITASRVRGRLSPEYTAPCHDRIESD